MATNGPRIDDEIRRLCRALTDDELRELRASLKAEGLRDHLMVWADENILLDGHHRLQLCEELGVTPKFKPAADVEDRESAIAWVIRNQLGRRNLNAEEIAYLRGKRYEMEKLTPAERNKIVAESKSSPRSKNRTEDRSDQPGKTAARLGREFGVGKRTVSEDGAFARAVDSIERNISPDAAQSIRTGQAKLTKTQVREIGAMPAEKQRDAYEQAKANPRKSRSKKEPPVRTNVHDLPRRDPGDDNIPALLKEHAGKISIFVSQIDLLVTTAPDVLARNVPSSLAKNIDDHLDAAIDWLVAFREERRRHKQGAA